MTTGHIEQDPLATQIGGGHYKSFNIQPIQFILANSIPFIEGNIIKYLCRWKTKNGLQDLQKARHYLDILIAEENNRLSQLESK
jgi:Protein of unknwon function (DUF3310)